MQLWPQEAIVRDDELIQFTINVMRDDSKPPGLNFSQHGGTIAIYDLDDLAVPRTMVFDVPHVRGNPFASDRLRVFATPDGYRAAAIRFLDQRLYLFSSASPAGPWTLDQVISLDAISPDTHAYAYEPLMLDMTDQQAIFAVNLLPGDPTETLSDVTLYGPRFMTVDLRVAG